MLEDLPGVHLRPQQQKILEYESGKMGISAVPGSGKTWTLSLLAANLIARGKLRPDQEILIVTLVNSAVDRFSQRVSSFLKELDLLPNVGYRVRTLHGLAHDIVRARPSLVGLDEQFTILDENDCRDILHEAALSWLRAHPNALDDFLSPDVEENRLAKVRREELPELVEEIGLAFVRTAKDQRIPPGRLQAVLEALPVRLPLAEMGCQIYADYQRALDYRAAVDFDDLIQLALLALESDPLYLERLRDTWPYILEDEAQDSSRLQEEILRRLVGEDGNWVRVGDPNQAIYETFTTASPRFLREFLREPGVRSESLPVSGRSTLSIIDLANYLVNWTMHYHPQEAVRDALLGPPWIEATPPDDPAPNPPDAPEFIHLSKKRSTPDGEIRDVVASLERWLPHHPDSTVAVLVPTQRYGFRVVEALTGRGLPTESSLLSSSQSTRQTARRLARLLGWLAEPGSPTQLAEAWLAWWEAQEQQPAAIDADADEARTALGKEVAEQLKKLRQVEDFLQPQPGRDGLEALARSMENPEVVAQLECFRQDLQRWQRAALLPVDQLILVLAQALFRHPAELALAHKLAGALKQASREHPDWRLKELRNELERIVKNERRLVGFSEEDSGFDPDRYKGQVVVATMHKAKGLEWDRVHLMSVNTYDFPGGQPGEAYKAEKWFLRGRLNLQAEALEQLSLAVDPGKQGQHPAYADWYQEGEATRTARLDYVRERLRLLYVGLTRARRELIVTWNTGREGGRTPLTMAQPLAALIGYWSDRRKKET